MEDEMEDFIIKVRENSDEDFLNFCSNISYKNLIWFR